MVNPVGGAKPFVGRLGFLPIYRFYHFSAPAGFAIFSVWPYRIYQITIPPVINVWGDQRIDHGAQSIFHSANQPNNKPMNEETNQSTNRRTGHSAHQPIRQINESVRKRINPRPDRTRGGFSIEPLHSRGGGSLIRS